MYNNFSSKKTKKVISALLASALVVTSAPITANAATVKKVGVGKTITYNAKATVKSVKSSKKGIVKATKKGKKVTIKGVKAGTTTVTVKTAKKTVKLNVKVGATKIAKKTLKTTMTAGTSQTVSVTATGGKGDTIKFASSNKAVLTVNKASAKASTKGIAKMGVKAVKEGTATLTVSSKNTGVKKAFKITVKAAAPAATNAPTVATTPGITTPTATVAATKAPSVATTPAVQTTAPAGTDAAATENPDATKDPNATVDPNATKDPNATVDPNATKDPNATQNPDVTEDPNATKDPNATNTPDATDAPSVSTNPAVTASPSAIEFTAKQTGEKKILITNPTAMTKNDIVVKRGNSTVTIDNIALSDDAKSALVTLAGSIVAVDYTITVGENSTKFTGEASTVKDIKITSDVVTITGDIGDDDTGKTGKAYYAVYNQFGENITAKTSLNANTSAEGIILNSNDGTMTITWKAAPRLNDPVSVVLMYQNTGISTSKMLSVATKAAPAEVEVYGVYNGDGKKLTATNVEKELFYYLFRVKDQFGNYMSSGDITTGTNLIVNTSSAMTNVDLNTKSLQTITVDGVNYLAYQIDRKEGTKDAIASGSITLMIIPGGSGKTVTDTIEIGSGTTVKSLTISVNGAVPRGGDTYLEYVALDENGDEVTEYRVLKQVKSSNPKFKWVKEDGDVKLKFDDSLGDSLTAAGSTVSTVFTLPSYETKLVTININDAAEQASIAGIVSDVSTATRLGDTVKIKVADLLFQDQYGNSIGKSLTANAVAPSDKEIAVMVVPEDNNNEVFNSLAANGKYLANTSGAVPSDPNATVYGAGDTITFTANSKDLLGTESFTFKLVQYDASTGKQCWVDYTSKYSSGAVANYTQTGAFTTTLTATEDKRFVSYTVNDIDSVWLHAGNVANGFDANSDYVPSVTVKGVLSNGQTVELDKAKDYKIVAGDYVANSGDEKITVNADDAKTYFDAHPTESTVKGKYQVVINYTGEKIDKTVTINKNNPSVGTIEFKDTHTDKGINLGSNPLTAKSLLDELKVKDNFGVAATLTTSTNTVEMTGKADVNGDGTAAKTDGTDDSADGTTIVNGVIKDSIVITVSDMDTIDGKVNNNGTTNPTFTGVWEEGDSFKVTFTAGTASFSTIVSVQKDYDFVAPVATLDASSNATQVVISFNEPLYDDTGAALGNDKALTAFVASSNASEDISVASYANNKIVLTISNFTNGDTITLDASKLFDAAGNAVTAATYTATVSGDPSVTTWN